LPFAKGDAANEANVRAFKQELEKLGWAEGRNVQFDEHWTTDDMSLVRAHATDLMGSLPDAVLAFGGSRPDIDAAFQLYPNRAPRCG
jgi:putative ABC transport system substrate-binding protein